MRRRIPFFIFRLSTCFKICGALPAWRTADPARPPAWPHPTGAAAAPALSLPSSSLCLPVWYEMTCDHCSRRRRASPFLPPYLPFLTESSSQRNIPLNHILLDFPNPIDQGCMSVKGRPIPLTVGPCIHFTHAACAWWRASASSASFFRGSVKARASADGPHSPPPPPPPSGEETRSVRSAAAASITVPSFPPSFLTLLTYTAAAAARTRNQAAPPTPPRIALEGLSSPVL